MLDPSASQGLSKLAFPGLRVGHQEGTGREDASSVEQISRSGDRGETNTGIKHEASLQDCPGNPVLRHTSPHPFSTAAQETFLVTGKQGKLGQMAFNARSEPSCSLWCQ